MRRLSAVIGVVAVSLAWSTPAFATSSGITGQSGKDGPTCSTCHQGGTAPTVSLEGPSELAPGATGEYVFIIRGGAAKTGGVGLAVDNAGATLQAGGTGLKKLGSELSHASPQPFTNNELRFTFSLVAPATDVTLTLFGAGNSSNADLSSDGDRAASTKLAVKVGKGSPTPQPDDGGDDEGGCAAAGGAPVWGLAMAVASRLLLRRRRS
ncbi:hypothetical protein LZ198_28690 [Myxococcus sp. K15C18031901]|uniref:MXAN_6652 family MXYO-CTERM-anchored protein n=1 Tax=Myxococcus dinghuensis TaxID=2906761 RepID=UPI0020A7DD8C|nr:MXAN_6652 family MXYO-CTERM-anchored protein [Myxococcus dinghuensis]MCP3102862.1 hypothetical protein [Myxococcus dinghuensis]